jgi:CubicO group peptidase (beta-lactamase class C family)
MADLLPSTAAHLIAAMAEEQVRARMPSMVAAVVRDGSVVWRGTRGRVVTRRGQQPTPDLQYRIGSITKSMTAAVVLQLRDEGMVDLSDPLGRHVPEAPHADRTLRSLLSHASGIQAEPVGLWWERSPGVDWPSLAAANARSAGVLPVGAQYHYSNLGYALLGQVVARCRRRSWQDSVQQHLLAPLRMRRTTYSPVQPHAEGFSLHPMTGVLTDEPAHDTGAMAPAGQLWSTVDDLCRWLSVLLNPQPEVLGAEAVADMTTPQSGASDDPSGYGLGLRLSRTGERLLVGHTGSMPGFLAGMFGDPRSRVGAVVLANGTTGLDVEGLPRTLIETVLAHEPFVPAEWVPPSDVDPLLMELAGLWHWGNSAYVATAEGETLVLAQLRGGRSSRLRVENRDRLVGLDGYFAGEDLHVMRAADGSINHLDLATFVFTREPYDPRAPIPGRSPT